MNKDFKKILTDIRDKKLAPVYLLDGEEPFYLDMLVKHFEEDILPPHERDFNLLVMYGKDADWAAVVNACRRFPMFAERQVVILKDAAQMKSLAELTGYLEAPSGTTVFVIEHRYKKVDGRSKLLKVAKDKGVYFHSEKVKDEALPSWIESYGKEHGWQIAPRESEMLAGYLGSDLQKIANELEKVRLNAPNEKNLTPELIQQYIGISKEYNVFDFPKALTDGQREKVYRMLAYFSANPKSAPTPLVAAALYNHFSKLYALKSMSGKSAEEITAATGINSWLAKKIMGDARHIAVGAVEDCLLLCEDFSKKGVGIHSDTDDIALLREFVGKAELALFAGQRFS